MRIFFDLDGTLIDSRQRLYQLFQHLVPASTLSFDAYWSFKRNKVGHRDILSSQYFYSDGDIEKFEKMWLEQIEIPERLGHDKPFDGVTNYLLNLKRQHLLYLVTSRQLMTGVMGQVASFGWSEIFSEILVTGQKTEKHELVKGVVSPDPGDWFVGDTGIDVEAGKQLGIKTAVVLSGFLSREKLVQYKPDLIVENVVQFKI